MSVESITAGIEKTFSRIATTEKVTVDGQELLPVYFAAGGFGGGTMPAGAECEGDITEECDCEGASEGFGGGGVVVPLGAYRRVGSSVRFVPNTVVLACLSLPVVCLGLGFLRCARR